MTTTNPKAPTHEIFHVVGDKEKSHWQKIGAAWENRDGDGMNLVFNYQPLTKGNTVVRKIKAKQEADQ